LLSDYRAGLLTSDVVTQVKTLAAESSTSITADAQGQLAKYRGVDLVKCNADEARAYLRRDLRSDSDFEGAACDLCRDLALQRAMVITRGSRGATVAEPDQAAYHVSAPRIRDVFDTVGAGDTTIAVITLALAAGAAVADAVQLANYASGIVVQHVGNYAPTPDDLRAVLTNGA